MTTRPGKVLRLRLPTSLLNEPRQQQAHRFNRLNSDHRKITKNKSRVPKRGKFLRLSFILRNPRSHRATLDPRAKLRDVHPGPLRNPFEHFPILDIATFIEGGSKYLIVIRRENSR